MAWSPFWRVSYSSFRRSSDWTIRETIPSWLPPLTEEVSSGNQRTTPEQYRSPARVELHTPLSVNSESSGDGRQKPLFLSTSNKSGLRLIRSLWLRAGGVDELSSIPLQLTRKKWHSPSESNWPSKFWRLARLTLEHWTAKRNYAWHQSKSTLYFPQTKEYFVWCSLWRSRLWRVTGEGQENRNCRLFLIWELTEIVMSFSVSSSHSNPPSR